MASSEQAVTDAANMIERVASEALQRFRTSDLPELIEATAEAVSGFKRVADLMELEAVERRAEGLAAERLKPGRERTFGGFIDEATDAEYDAVIEQLLKRRGELLDALWPGTFPEPVVDAGVVDDPPGKPAPPQPPDHRPVG